MTLLAFKHNPFPTIGVELELQLIDLHTFNLAMEASDFLRRLATIQHPGEIKPEITLAMIELKTLIAKEAARMHIGVCGGGAHPFQKWQEQRIFPTERFTNVSEQYGYLAKQFTIFGQHIHIGCPHGDDALYLCHAFAHYLPQFIALSAASPFHQGVDTSFDCSRLTIISAFPLSGTPPWLLTWDEFEGYFANMFDLGIVKCMKDFYWDIRPKPEFGTVEIRICDTPLTVDKAADLAAYAQLLVYWLLETRPRLSRDIYLTYLYNRFNASRYGLNAAFIDPIQREQRLLSEDIFLTCKLLEPYAKKLGSEQALERIRLYIHKKENDALWIRKNNHQLHSLAETVRNQVEVWNC
jgi:glutamate---cysteine ligase / carboxylate-amine ligase